ncbi:tRNA pseudouridine(38-40) synthase TruA [Bacillus sp. FJAT-42315]|uniref:tRNA pseudouridine(38-40) synthase TruA n=1 Tax=Bacillus sp. FJAT-42315 TaxID=2014077 RepID=UPI000C249016|nr:tRNA pseudouridine(38-40) synthase TruA [Bacillus sp. FJAT-42315]
MNRIKCIISYDGALFSGYQIQPNGRTVQEELEKVLKKMHKGRGVKVTASGRTDAGVHAVGQVIHFDTPLELPAERWSVALNSQLPGDIAVLTAETVPQSFHARFSPIGKEYRYKIYQEPHRSPFKRFYAYHCPFDLNLESMRQAAAYLIGTHDFTSFCSAKTEVQDKVREVKEITIEQRDHEIELKFVGNGFLYNMVRIMTGTLMEVGMGKRDPYEVKKILEAKDRGQAGKTAPAEGLYLQQVFYGN